MLTDALRRGMTAALLTLSLAVSAGPASAAGGGGAWPWPVAGEVATPYRNGADPYAAGQHRGLDIAAPAGTPVRASVGGRVSFAGTLPDGGVTVTVSGAGYLVSYLHLATRALARGDRVTEGALIGAVGTTGKRSITRPHLHFGVRLATGGYVDPLTLLGPPGSLAASPPVAPELPAVAPRSSAPRAARPADRHPAAIESAPRVRRVPDHDTANVHARPTGDATATAASRQPPAHRGHVAANARESHASVRAGRVAPPPLRMPTPARPPAVREESHTQAALPREARPPWRLLMFAAAGLCGAALFLRRRPAESPIPADPSAPETAADASPPRLRSVS